MMIKLRGFYVYMDAAGEGGSGGGAAGVDDAAGAGAEGGAGAGEGAAAKPTESGSLLAKGAEGGAPAGSDEYIPEKLRVLKDDGTLDLEASSRKVVEAYTNAEKRIGSGDIPPKTAEEYAVTVPDAFKEAFNAEEDPGFKDFREKAHKLNFTQPQLDLVMASYFDMAPKLVQGAMILDEAAATAELQKTWATPADFDKNLKHSYLATETIAKKAGIPIADIMASPLKNDPMFHRLMAVIGPELMEDSNPGGDILGGEDAVNEMMNSEAYKDRNHQDHAKVSAKVKAYFEKKYGNEAAA